MNIEITEVGLRDGLQSLSYFLPTSTKLEILALISKSGIKNVELTSFVSPKHVPQLADSSEFSAEVFADPSFSALGFSALVPNLRGAMSASKCGYDSLRFFVSTSETHNLKNTNQTIEKSLDELQKIREALPNIHLSVILATVFGCPYEGQVPMDKILSIAERVLTIGANDIGLADTYGKSRRDNTFAILKSYISHFGDMSLPFLHLHNFDGNVFDNVKASLELGFSRFDSAFSGLGGCPAINDFNGNLSTEKLVRLLDSLGYEHNLDKELLAENYSKISALLFAKS